MAVMDHMTISAIPCHTNTILSRFLKVRMDIGLFLEKVVLPSGYPFFEWNDRIYKMTGKCATETSWKFADL